MRLRIPEVRQHAIAHVVGDVAVVAFDHRRAGPLVGADHGAHVLGIETLRERRGTDQIREQHGQLAASRGFPGGRRRGGTWRPAVLDHGTPSEPAAAATAERGARQVVTAAGGTARDQVAPQRVQNCPDRPVAHCTSGSSSRPHLHHSHASGGALINSRALVWRLAMAWSRAIDESDRASIDKKGERAAVTAAAAADRVGSAPVRRSGVPRRRA